MESKIIAEDIRRLSEALTKEHARLEGQTILITGAGGLLGKYMVMLLKYLNDHVLERPLQALLLDNFVTGYQSSVLTDQNLTFIRHNVIEPFQTDQSIDYIIHAAGIASPFYYTKYPLETLDVGTVGTRNMLELAREKRVKGFLFTSSSEVYGDPDPQSVPTPETYFGNVSIVGPRACYDESKRLGETLCVTFWRVFNVPVKMGRPFNVYGPGIRPDDYRVLPNFLEHALRRMSLPVHGGGKNTRAFCYINDAIESIFKLLLCDTNGEPFNIGNPNEEIAVVDLAHLVAGMFPYEVEVKKTKPPHDVYANSDPKRRCPDISKLQATVDFQPKYDLKEGIQRTIQWYCEEYGYTLE